MAKSTGGTPGIANSSSGGASGIANASSGSTIVDGPMGGGSGIMNSEAGGSDIPNGNVIEFITGIQMMSCYLRVIV
jgi:hypothetical protein